MTQRDRIREAYICKGCAVTCMALMDIACDCKPTACLFSDIAKNYDPIWEKVEPAPDKEVCPACQGTGKELEYKCLACNGTGKRGHK